MPTVRLNVCTFVTLADEAIFTAADSVTVQSVSVHVYTHVFAVRLSFYPSAEFGRIAV